MYAIPATFPAAAPVDVPTLPSLAGIPSYYTMPLPIAPASAPSTAAAAPACHPPAAGGAPVTGDYAHEWLRYNSQAGAAIEQPQTHAAKRARLQLASQVPPAELMRHAQAAPAAAALATAHAARAHADSHALQPSTARKRKGAARPVSAQEQADAQLARRMLDKGYCLAADGRWLPRDDVE